MHSDMTTNKSMVNSQSANKLSIIKQNQRKIDYGSYIKTDNSIES